MSNYEPPVPVTRAEFGNQETHYALNFPTLESDGSLHFIPEDGENHTIVPVKTFAYHYRAVPQSESLTEMLNAMATEKMPVVLQKVELILTDARIIVHAVDPKTANTKFVAHLWYPWISEVGFRPKQSFLNESAISLGFVRDFPNPADGTWWERFEFSFEKTFHPSDLAQEITRRIAAHHLKNDAPESATATLTTMLTPVRLPDPPKGEFSSYFPAAYVTMPGGVPYVEWGEPLDWEWILVKN